MQMVLIPLTMEITLECINIHIYNIYDGIYIYIHIYNGIYIMVYIRQSAQYNLWCIIFRIS